MTRPVQRDVDGDDGVALRPRPWVRGRDPDRSPRRPVFLAAGIRRAGDGVRGGGRGDVLLRRPRRRTVGSPFLGRRDGHRRRRSRWAPGATVQGAPGTRVGRTATATGGRSTRDRPEWAGPNSSPWVAGDDGDRTRDPRSGRRSPSWRASRRRVPRRSGSPPSSSSSRPPSGRFDSPSPGPSPRRPSGARVRVAWAWASEHRPPRIRGPVTPPTLPTRGVGPAPRDPVESRRPPVHRRQRRRRSARRSTTGSAALPGRARRTRRPTASRRWPPAGT